MHTLILLRHAKAVTANEAPSDEARRLAPRGHKDAAAAGAAIAALDLGVTHVVVSPAARTMETAAGVAPHLGAITLLTRPALYLAPAQTLRQEAAACRGDSVMVIAHNPGLHELVCQMLEEAHDRSRAAKALLANFPTCAFAVFGFASRRPDDTRPRLIASGSPCG